VTTTRSINGFSMAGGGGLDVAIKPWFAIRVGQLDYDYFRFQGQTLDGFRAGGGVVFRLGKWKSNAEHQTAGRSMTAC
jgi:hypothetical protein